ncbi:hypothetical protein DFH07DRAFT_941520 [Mycena maculata]|uniref:Uncharacterized protein n=1 Tax=Mycena maculata TaxID=230809 RepID=A0AAD7J0S1_9AGAR|nr:hypothetical protein DFH07DRAFT_941520 [Mycena maculata]
MSSNPAHYNTADRVEWERYASNLHKAGAGMGPVPGLPPRGYRECFILTQKFAPLPEHYPNLFIGKADQPAKAPGEVLMSEGAFGSMLESQHRFVHAVLAHTANQGQRAHRVGLGGPPQPADYRPAAYGHHRGYRHGFGRRGTHFRGRGGYGGHRDKPLADRLDGRGSRAGGPRPQKNHRPYHKHTRRDSFASDIAEAGTDVEMEGDAGTEADAETENDSVISVDDIPEEGEELDDGFNNSG